MDPPQGVTQFTAVPKLADTCNRTAGVKSRTLRRTSTKSDEEGLSGMMTRLSFRKKKDSAALRREKSQKSLKDQILQARRITDAQCPQHTHSTESDAPTSRPNYHFPNPPSGIIRFTATPKPVVKSDRNAHRKSGAPRQTQTKSDVDGLSGMLTRLSFRKKTESAASRREKAQQESKYQILQERRSGRPTTQSNAAPQYFKGVMGRFEPWIGCRRKSFSVIHSHETTMNDSRCHSISFMSDYQNMSFEELRVQDYLSGLKGRVSMSHLGPSFSPAPGVDTIARGPYTYTVDIRHQCITAMQEYENESLEELRLEHYMPSVGWKDREAYSEKEMQRLSISLHSDVYVYLSHARRRGKVRFIGRLPDRPHFERYVGIEMDGSYGDGHGYYKGTKLFRTKRLHARIASLNAVLPAHLVSEEEAKASENATGDSINSSPNKSDSKASKCSVCWANDVEMFFLPCGHVCCCNSCSKLMKDCPICRKRITTKHRAYLT